MLVALTSLKNNKLVIAGKIIIVKRIKYPISLKEVLEEAFSSLTLNLEALSKATRTNARIPMPVSNELSKKNNGWPLIIILPRIIPSSKSIRASGNLSFFDSTRHSMPRRRITAMLVKTNKASN
jgi:hypothetical protein